jgi:hypothetical protein
MNNFFKENKELEELLKFFNVPGTHSLIFLKIGNSLILYISLFGLNNFNILTTITTELSKYNHPLVEKYSRGWGYILVPQQRKVIGDFDIGALLAYNMDDKSFLSEVIDLESSWVSTDKLPLFNKN